MKHSDMAYMEWFVLKNGDVIGPCTTEAVSNLYSKQDVLIWGIPSQEWLSFSAWSAKVSSSDFSESYSSSKVFSQVHVVESRNESIKDQEKPVVSSSVKEEKVQSYQPSPLPNIPKEDPIPAATVKSPEPKKKQPLAQVLEFSQPRVEIEKEKTSAPLKVEEKIQQIESKTIEVQSADEIFGIQEDSLPSESDSFSLDEFISSEQSSEDSQVSETTNIQNDVFDMSSVETEWESKSADEMAASALGLEAEDFKKEDSSESDLLNFNNSSNDNELEAKDLFSHEPKNNEFNHNDINDNDLFNEDSTSSVSEASENSLGSFSLEDFDSELSARELNSNLPIPDEDGVTNIDINLNEFTNISDLKEFANNMEATRVQEIAEWHMAYDGQSDGPMNVSSLLKKLDSVKNYEFVYLWKKGFQDWQNIFDTPQISSQLGIGFRRHDRVEVEGKVEVEFKGNIQKGLLENLSTSGFGAYGFTSDLPIGETVKVKITSSELAAPVEFVSKIRFVSDRGVLGASFVKDQFVENVNKLIHVVKSKESSEAA